MVFIPAYAVSWYSSQGVHRKVRALQMSVWTTFVVKDVEKQRHVAVFSSLVTRSQQSWMTCRRLSPSGANNGSGRRSFRKMNGWPRPRGARSWLGQLGRDSGDFWSKNPFITSLDALNRNTRIARCHKVPSALVVVPFFPLPVKCIQTYGATEMKLATIFDPSLWGGERSDWSS
ncbi:hypothetical protein EDD15DRAFT_1019916 [Pisolithus albus]|nr:hypothetical protein EDD15DRAFT_1019916 [Pisolithus albus]